MATKTSAQSGNWSSTSTWVGGVIPVATDAVVIASGHNVVYDVLSGSEQDLSSLVITGTLTAKTDAGNYVLKVSGDISGAGTFNIGTASVPYPSACTFTINFDSTDSQISGGSGLKCNFYCTQPTNPHIRLSGAEESGQTELSVDTDVTGDVWKAGDSIRIDDVNGRDSEVRVINSGGITAGSITVTSGITNAKIAGALVVLVSRNIRITGSTGYAVESLGNSVLGCEISGCTNGLNSSYSNTISGTISGCDRGLYYSYSNTISGTISGCTNGLYYSYSNTISGTISGCDRGLNSSYSNTLYGVEFDSVGVENYAYADIRHMPHMYTPSHNHDGVLGAFKAWTRGGIVLSAITTPPTGLSKYFTHECEDASNPCFRQVTISLLPGQTLNVVSYMRISGGEDLSANSPAVSIIDPGADPLWGTGEVALATEDIPVANGTVTAWQSLPQVSYKNSGSIPMDVIVRAQAQHATADVDEVWIGEIINEDGSAGTVNSTWSW